MDIIFLLGRVLFGGFFILSGWNHLKNMSSLTQYAASKGVPSPALAVVVSGLMILLGGVGVLFNAYLDISLLLIVAFLVVTSFKMHNYWTITDAMQQMSERINFRKNMALVGAALIMLSSGPLHWGF